MYRFFAMYRYIANSTATLSHVYTCLTFLLACESIINCSRGSQCEIDQDKHQAYCEPSCDLDNGGCADNKVCSLQQHNCTSGPCPPVVQCLGELNTHGKLLAVTY